MRFFSSPPAVRTVVSYIGMIVFLYGSRGWDRTNDRHINSVLPYLLATLEYILLILVPPLGIEPSSQALQARAE